MTLYHVAAQASGSKQRTFEIHERAGLQVSKICPSQGLRREIGFEGIGFDIQRSKANPVNCDTAAFTRIRCN